MSRIQEFDIKPSPLNHPSSNQSQSIGTVNDTIFKSVVKVFAVTCAPNYSRPWQMLSQTHRYSTGFVIDGKRILCSAYGVTNARSIRLRKHGDSKKYDATILHIGHECDLAILTVENDKFWIDLKPLQFDYKTPELQDTVVVVGYPKGGDNICVTKGVVSRVGFVVYGHASETLFSLQIDAAINPGNNGGPTLMNNRVVGIAFDCQYSSDDTQNIGYCIPIRVVMHFLNDIEQHGTYTNFPKLGIKWQNIESQSLKKYFKMVPDYNPNQSDSESDEKQQELQDERTGILINLIRPLTDCVGKLKVNDVLLKIDGVDIGDDGTIKYGVSRIDFTYITTHKFCGDQVELTILRDGQIMKMNIILESMNFNYLVPIVLYDEPVTYYIFGGFVFVPLSLPYLKSEYGSNWSSQCSARLKDLYFYGYKEDKDDEVVILSRVLASDINVGYHSFTNRILQKVNDKQVKNVKQVIFEIESCIKNKKSKFVYFQFERNVNMILEIDEAIKGMTKIMKEHEIKFDRSANLRCNAMEMKEQIESSEESGDSEIVENEEAII